MLSGPPIVTRSSQQTSHNANIVFDLPSIMFNMNRLSKEQQIRVVAALVEGNSLRSTSRMTGVARNTVTALLLDLAEGCVGYKLSHYRVAA
jgi:lambda repressor-like predicted transcriptional regulator